VTVAPTYTLPFTVQPDLAATMDIQIPALAWQPTAEGWQRSFYLGGHEIPVEVRESINSLSFFYDVPARVRAVLTRTLGATFATPVAQLTLGPNAILARLGRQYGGVIVMTAPPFEALVLTILSQNRTGEIVRAVYPRLAAACLGITPDALAGLPFDDLAAAIRSAGPYKAARLHETARTIAAIGEPAFDAIVRGPDPQALTYLESLPGVAHKTAACVLVFSAGCTTTIPVDTHLFRVADRLGLARHDGRNTKTTRDQLITTLLTHGPDLVPAHFLFLLVGRTTCVAGPPQCARCFLAPLCPHPKETLR
jgi:endonuclease III